MFDVKDGSIDFDGVFMSYRQKADVSVLSDIDLHIKPGETIGIIGATGSGKSSLVSLIPRLYDVSAGSVKVGGVDVRDYDIETLRSNVAMVLQKNVLFSGSITENLRWWQRKRHAGEEIEEACRQACARRVHPTAARQVRLRPRPGRRERIRRTETEAVHSRAPF